MGSRSVMSGCVCQKVESGSTSPPQVPAFSLATPQPKHTTATQMNEKTCVFSRPTGLKFVTVAVYTE